MYPHQHDLNVFIFPVYFISTIENPFFSYVKKGAFTSILIDGGYQLEAILLDFYRMSLLLCFVDKRAVCQHALNSSQHEVQRKQAKYKTK